MADDAADFFRFLTNSYLSETSPESAQRLWQAVFALPGLYFLMRDVGGESVPAIALSKGPMVQGSNGPRVQMHDDVAHLLVWTDLDSLRAYALESDAAKGEPKFLFAPLPKVIETILRFADHGVTSVRFNAPLGWSVPMERLKTVAQQLGVRGA